MTNQALRSVDVIWSIALGEEDKEAQAFIADNTEGETLFHANQADFYNPTLNMDIAKQHPEIYAQAREKGRDILSDPAKLRGALATRLGTDALQNTLEALSAKVDNAATITQIAKDLQEGKISKTEALSRALEQGEDVVEGIIWSAVSAGKSLYGQATTSSKDFEAVYGNGAGNEIESLTWGIIGASIAINGRHKGRGRLHDKINDRKLTLNLPKGYKKNKDGNIITPEGEILTKGTFTTPSGRTYDHYGREVDMDLKIPGKPYTNKEWMKKGNNPYVLDENGIPVPTNQHHIDQRASGPIIEMPAKEHQANNIEYHPFGKNKNPNDPVDHENEWNKDRVNINKQRSVSDSE